MMLHQDDCDDTSYLLQYEIIKRARSRSRAVPVCSLALMLLDFYLRFMEEIDQPYFPIRNTGGA